MTYFTTSTRWRTLWIMPRVSGDDAGAFRRGLEQNLRRAVAADDLVRNRGALEIQLDQIFLGLLDTLFDGHRNFAGFAHSEAGMAVIVANDDERGKAEVLAALDDFGDAIDGDNVVLQLGRIDREQPANRETFP